MNGRTRVKSSKASLIGGIAVGVVAFVLWTAVAHELRVDNAVVLIIGVLMAVTIAAWIRAADL